MTDRPELWGQAPGFNGDHPIVSSDIDELIDLYRDPASHLTSMPIAVPVLEGLQSASQKPKDDEDTDDEPMLKATDAYLVVKPEEYFPVWTRTRDVHGGEIIIDDRPANGALPTMIRGPSEHPEAHGQPRFNLNANAEAPTKEAAIFSRLGLLKVAHEHVAAQDMIDVGLDPFDTGEQGDKIRELQQYLPGAPPSPIKKPSFDLLRMKSQSITSAPSKW